MRDVLRGVLLKGVALMRDRPKEPSEKRAGLKIGISFTYI
jgi:hypothetical protein